jgi:hypothetical protein
MLLSKHFDSGEFACKCGCGRAAVSPRLVAALEAVRTKIGDRPLLINSGVRCEAHNKAVGGSPNSQHVYGNAADVRVEDLSGDDIYLVARDVPVLRGFGVAGLWCHLDVRRGLLSRWRYDSNGRVVAWPEGEL